MPKFIFVRHGYSCSNSIGHLVESNILEISDGIKLSKSSNQIKSIFNSNIQPLNDSVLTHLGVNASIHNGCIMNKVLRTLFSINKINYLNRYVKIDINGHIIQSDCHSKGNYVIIDI